MTFWIGRANAVIQPALDFAFPPRCLGCDAFDESHEFLCHGCRERIQKLPGPLCLCCHQLLLSGETCPTCGELSLRLMAWGFYQPPLDEAIIQMKFHGVTKLADLFAARLAEMYGESIREIRPDFLVPIPLHPLREDSRGFNQSALLAAALGGMLEIAVDETLLHRRLRRKPQSKLDHTRRMANIKGVFRADEALCRGVSVILVDDIVTTGATVFEARRALVEAGSRVPAVVAIARAA